MLYVFGPRQKAQAPPAPRGLPDVCGAELEYLQARRGPNGETVPPDRIRRSLVGLALSGGGIRSATTNLGILQALSRMGVLPLVDYLSTVSGGGYIGSCLTSLLSLNAKALRGPGQGQIPGHAAFEFAPGDNTRFTTEWKDFPFNPDPGRCAAASSSRSRCHGWGQVSHLRTHGNFLIARKGVFARETLRSVGTLLSGIVYHLAIVLLALFAASAAYVTVVALLAPGLAARFAQGPPLPGPSFAVVAWEGGRSLAHLAPAETLVTKTGCDPAQEGCTVERRESRTSPSLRERVLFNAGTVRRALLDEGLGPLLGSPGRPGPLPWALALGLLTTVASFSWLRARLDDRASGGSGGALKPKEGESDEDVFERRLLRQVGYASLAVVAAATAGLRTAHELWPWGGVPAVAWLFIPLAVVAGLRLAGLLLHLLLPWLRRRAVPGQCAAPRTYWTRGFRSLWAAYEAMQSYALWASAAAALLPIVIYAVHDYRLPAAGALLALAASRWLAPGLLRPSGGRWSLPPGARRVLLGAAVAAGLVLVVLFFSAMLVGAHASWRGPAGWTLGAGAAFLALGFVVDVNKLSPHYFYRDRLGETYLATEVRAAAGALETLRDTTEMRLEWLHGMGADGRTVWGNTAPYHLISCALNLAGSRDLTRKDRKSGYFLFSKLFCGSEQTAYRPTAAYRAGETKLGRAITISGAAASAAMGYQTFFAQAFAMVVFNLRLGYWMANPRHQESLRGEERVFWPRYLWREMLLKTDERSALVNLSDGGHTGDNVGIYPLLQRRCQVIIACDAERDSDLTFGSLTEALRHAYIDHGIEVDIDLTMLRPDPQSGLSRTSCAVGRIRYPDRPEQQSWLVYLKNCLTGEEPEPVLNYKSRCPAFPHESTADQFFDDAQFESYRALGAYIAERAFGEWVYTPEFACLQARHWPFPHQPPALEAAQAVARRLSDEEAWRRLQILHTPFRAVEKQDFQKLTDAFAALQARFLLDEDLLSYHEECHRPLPGCPPGQPPPRAAAAPPVDTKAAALAMMQLQLMEEVYFALRLDRYANSPDNRGWMNVFRQWGRSPRFNRQFAAHSRAFTREFQDFYAQYLEDYDAYIDEQPIPHPWDPPAVRARCGHGPQQPPPRGVYLDSGIREARREDHEPRAAPLPPPQDPASGAHATDGAKGPAPAAAGTSEGGDGGAPGGAPNE